MLLCWRSFLSIPCRFFCLCHLRLAAKASCFQAVCLSHSSVHSSGQMLLPRYLMNGLSNCDETYREYSLAPTDDLIRFWRSKVKVTAGHWGGEGIHVDSGASKSICLVAVLVFVFLPLTVVSLTCNSASSLSFDVDTVVQCKLHVSRWCCMILLELVILLQQLSLVHVQLDGKYSERVQLPTKVKFWDRYNSAWPLLPHPSTDHNETWTPVFLLSGERKVNIHETANRAQPNSAHGLWQPRPPHSQRSWKALPFATHLSCLTKHKLTVLRMS